MESRKTELRTVKLMSKEDSLYKRFLLEISVNDLTSVVSENFWPQGVRVRTFRGKGNDWIDRDVPVQEAESVTENEAENNNSSLHSN